MLKLVFCNNDFVSPQGTSISRLDLRNALDAIFIINALIVAIVKDSASSSAKAKMTITVLRQSMLAFEHNDNISELEFFKLSDQFYSAIAQLTRFKRVTNTILQEKVHIDRILRLSLRDSSGCKAIIKVYAEILNAMESNRSDATLNLVSNLGQVLEAYALMAKANAPDFFERENPISNHSENSRI